MVELYDGNVFLFCPKQRCDLKFLMKLKFPLKYFTFSSTSEEITSDLQYFISHSYGHFSIRFFSNLVLMDGFWTTRSPCSFRMYMRARPEQKYLANVDKNIWYLLEVHRWAGLLRGWVAGTWASSLHSSQQSSASQCSYIQTWYINIVNKPTQSY